MHSLPSLEIISPYFAKNKGYKVSKESMITYKKHKYSVPIRFIGEYLTVKENGNSLEIYYNTDLIVTYQLSDKFLNYKKEHAKEILKSDALRNKTEQEIEEFIEKNLSNMDILLE